MLNYLKINNIRLFDNGKAEFPLSRITVFCGTNSCGKSTILKTLLLLRQSQGLYESYGTRTGTLRFTGAQVDLGNYPSFVSNNDIKKNIEISIEIADHTSMYVFDDLFKSKYPGIKTGKFRNSLTGVEYKLKIDFTFTASQSLRITDEAGEIKTNYPDGILKKSKWSLSALDKELASWEVNVVSSDKGRNRYQISDFHDPNKELEELNKSKNKKDFVLDIDLDGLVVGRYLRVNQGDTTKRRLTIRALPYYIAYSTQRFITALRRIHYIAPLRAPAKRYYLTNFDITPDLDPQGEFIPYFLGGIIEEPVVVNVPPKLVTPIKQNLSDALNGWLYYLRTGCMFYQKKNNEFSASTHQSALVEIGLKGMNGITIHPLADSGFGYSQILPIIVRGLMAPVGSTIVIEQPELHLNPALQVRLADFFIAMVHADKQIIIETHSEHIVNAIRVRTAKDIKGFLSKNSKIYFVDIKRNKPVIHNMNINENGTIPHWPINFFGEAANLTTELLRAQKLIKNQIETTKGIND
jgi:predicted ATPase